MEMKLMGQFAPFNETNIERADQVSGPENYVYEVAWQCPDCSHNSLAGTAVTASDFDAKNYIGNDELCPNCAQAFEGKAEQYFLGPLAAPKVDHWIDGDPA